MTKETMTVHQALCELKTLDDRIEKAIQGTTFVFANKHSNTKVGGQSIAERCKDIEAALQSAKDLIARRNAIKRGVIVSNAETKVTVAGTEYTVAEAIDMKNYGVPIQQVLLQKLSSDLQVARRSADSANGDKLEERATEYIKSLYGNADMKGASEDMKKMRDEFIAAQTVELVDPIHVAEEMERLQKETSAFMVEIDSALSVSNALTAITIEY